MCGIAGVFSPDGQSLIAARGIVEAMAASIASRGPDDSGTWVDDNGIIALGHRRLAVVDISPAGHQPMESGGSRYVIVFNGEIYNHFQLRNALDSERAPVSWRGYSDTETLLAGFDHWGIEATVKRAVGMFAFAVWDKQMRALTLGRDRLGEKPIYYGWQGNTFLFGSDLKAFKAHPAFQATIDRDALALFLRHSSIPAPYSIYLGIKKLLPGSLISISARTRDSELVRYWDARQVISNGLANPFDGSPTEAIAKLDQLLSDSIAQQMIADVPIGAFLSGGVDSSTVVALMQAHSSIPVRTFTIGFSEPEYNEAVHAKAVARHLGTNHTELYVTASQAMDVIPQMPAIYSEPFADSSQIPTFLVSKLARQGVTVALSGDGGDELFGGYSRYAHAEALASKVSYAPVLLRKSISKLLTSVSASRIAEVITPFETWLPKMLNGANIGHRVHKVGAMVAAPTPAEFYRLLISHWDQTNGVVLNAIEPATVLTDSTMQPQTDSFIHHMMALDLLGYLPNDILTKVDRASMAVGLETRVPLLDHRIVEFAWQLPLGLKSRNGVCKWPLRQILNKYVPSEMIDRPKMGFGVPIGEWLRGPLRSWAEDLLDDARLRQEGYFNPGLIRRKWIEHLSGARNWEYHLWDVLMFQAWIEAQ